jgi:ABC-type uncharacterized transport system permease subunit
VLSKNKSKQSFGLIVIMLVLGAGTLVAANLIKFPNIMIPIEFLGLLPYILTILVLTGFVRKVVGPAAVGRPYEKQ